MDDEQSRLLHMCFCDKHIDTSNETFYYIVPNWKTTTTNNNKIGLLIG